MKLYIKRTVDMHSTCVLDAYILPFGYITIWTSIWKLDIYISLFDILILFDKHRIMNITGCVIQSPDQDLAERRSATGHRKN